MKKTVLIITLFIAQFTFAQDFKFGKVSKAELEETQHQLEPNANAAVLYRNQDIKLVYLSGTGFVQENYIHERIKIYNKEGFDYATIKIKLYDGSNTTDDDLIGLKAYTYTLENDKIVETKLKNNDIFEEKTNRYWKSTQFAMPNIKENCIIEYKYKIRSELIGIDDVPFQKTIPINKLDFKVATPEYYRYSDKLNPKANYNPKLEYNQEYKKIKFSYRRLEKEIARGVTTELVEFEKDVRFSVIENKSVNIPALKEEAYVNNLNNYQAKLVMELASVKYPDQPVESFATSWEDVTKSIYSNEDFGRQLNKTSYFKKDLEAILIGVTTPTEKVATVYDFVKSKVKWNNLVNYYAENGVSKAYKQGSGNVADINLMLVAMLRHAGLQANPVLVSTRSNGIPFTATKSGFNYVIAVVEFAEGMVLLDASSTYATANILPENILNWQGRIIREDDTSSWVNLMPQQNAKQLNFLNATINEDFTINGKVREQLTNHFALAHREAYNSESEEEHIRAIEEGKGDIEVSNVTVKAENELTKPILISYEYNLQNGIEEIADKLYFSSLLFFAPEENPFKQESRAYPIDFTYPVSEKYVVNIRIPEGYQVESLPENEKMQFNINDGVFTYLINHKNDLIQITTNLDINKTIILPKDYLEFKRFFDLIIKKQTEQIVLKKG